MKALLIAEKPSLRRTIEAVYNKYRKEIDCEITFMDQRGHLLTLVLPDEMDASLKRWQWQTLPIEPETLGGWQYKVIPEKKTGNFLTAGERYDAIRKKLEGGGYDFIINAGDPDQEGELLIRIVLARLHDELGINLPIKRFWSNDTTEPKVLEALKSLRDDDSDPMLVNLLKAAYGRQHSDYRVGMNLSRAASLKMNTRVACGRVKTPIMAIVCRRENEIKNFVPSTVYGVKVHYAEGFDGQLIEPGILNEVTGSNETVGKEASAGSKTLSAKDKTGSKASDKSKADPDAANDDAEDKEEGSGLVWFDTKEEAEELIRTLSGPAKVIKFQSRKVQTQPPKLYKLATLQIAAGKLGYSSSKTLEIVQTLYERGYVSYPRTDCEFISSNEKLYDLLRSAMSVPELEEYIKTISNGAIKKVRSSKRWVNDKKLQEAGHSALIPTTYKPDFDKLSHEQQDIYRLICRQFVSIFLPPLVQKKVEMLADISGQIFRTTGKTLVDEGYTKIFGTKLTEASIPQHRAGDSIDTESFELAEKTSSCPKRFTDADLIAVCEAPHRFLTDMSHKALGRALKIGTSATRASIIEELIRRDKYLQRQKEKKTEYIVPTEAGMAIYERLKDRKICQVDMTAEWEEKLETIRSGRLDLPEFEESMRRDVRAMIEDIRSMGTAADSRGVAHSNTTPAAGNNIINGGRQQREGNAARQTIHSRTVHNESAAAEIGAKAADSRDRRAVTADGPAYPVVGRCPECGAFILSGPKGFFCSGFRQGCGVGCYKTVSLGDMPYTVSDDEFAMLLKGGTETVTAKPCNQGSDMKADISDNKGSDTKAGVSDNPGKDTKADTSYDHGKDMKTDVSDGHIYILKYNLKARKIEAADAADGGNDDAEAGND